MLSDIFQNDEATRQLFLPLTKMLVDLIVCTYGKTESFIAKCGRFHKFCKQNVMDLCRCQQIVTSNLQNAMMKIGNYLGHILNVSLTM